MVKTTKKHHASRSMARGRPRRVWKRERWRPYKVLVMRDQRGRFRHWYRIRPKPRKAPLRRYAKIQYEEFKTPSRWGRGRQASTEPSRVRTYARRKLEEMPKGRGVAIYDSEKRFEFYGTGKQLYRAIAKSKNRRRGRVPKGYIRVSAERYLDDSARYEEEGDWSPFVKVESM